MDIKMRKIKTVQDIIDWRLCIGCGVCTYVCENDELEMADIPDKGRRPLIKKEISETLNEKIIEICPGISLENVNGGSNTEADDDDVLIGKTIEIWEGYAADDDIRWSGSSGGILSALAAYCIEKENMGSVLHTGMDQTKPWLNKSVISHNREEIIANAGSRYSPSSPCELLKHAVQGKDPAVFIGKPCDAAGVINAGKIDPDLSEKIGAVLTFFCAGPPNTRATVELCGENGVDIKDIKCLSYRGAGWPGGFKIIDHENNESLFIPYESSWGRLASKARQLRCHLCPDGFGEFGDISCGDAWHLKNEKDNIGESVVLVRTERGQRILHGAIAGGYVTLKRIDKGTVVRAQNLTSRKQLIVPRINAMKFFGLPVPAYEGFYLNRSMKGVSIKQRVKNYLGMAKRVVTRKLYQKE
jgi:coenzyme F420 hydrogenase subunit beta